jgi:hypothetical protein
MGYRKSCFEYIFLSDNVNVASGQFCRFAASERYINSVEVFISEYYRIKFSLAVPNLAARFSGVLAYVEAPGDGSWNY